MLWSHFTPSFSGSSGRVGLLSGECALPGKLLRAKQNLISQGLAIYNSCFEFCSQSFCICLYFPSLRVQLCNASFINVPRVTFSYNGYVADVFPCRNNGAPYSSRVIVHGETGGFGFPVAAKTCFWRVYSRTRRTAMQLDASEWALGKRSKDDAFKPRLHASSFRSKKLLGFNGIIP